MFGLFRRKKKVDETVGSLRMTKEGTSLKSRSDEDKDSSKYFRKRREEVKLTDVLGKLLQKLKTLDSERAQLVQGIYQLGGEAEEEAEEIEKELSTLKERITELEEVLCAIHAHRKRVRSQELEH